VPTQRIQNFHLESSGFAKNRLQRFTHVWSEFNTRLVQDQVNALLAGAWLFGRGRGRVAVATASAAARGDGQHVGSSRRFERCGASRSVRFMVSVRCSLVPTGHCPSLLPNVPELHSAHRAFLLPSTDLLTPRPHFSNPLCDAPRGWCAPIRARTPTSFPPSTAQPSSSSTPPISCCGCCPPPPSYPPQPPPLPPSPASTAVCGWRSPLWRRPPRPPFLTCRRRRCCPSTTR